jgi:hypothetical protein
VHAGNFISARRRTKHTGRARIFAKVGSEVLELAARRVVTEIGDHRRHSSVPRNYVALTGAAALPAARRLRRSPLTPDTLL